MGKKVNATQVKNLRNKGAILIDVRNPVVFRDGTVAGATNLVVSNISQLIAYPKHTKFIFFGENKDDPNLKMMLKYATQMFTDVFFLENKDDLI